MRLAAQALEQGIVRDPHDVTLRRIHMQLHQRRAEVTGSADARLTAIDAARQALALYPLDPHGIAALADRQREAGEAAQDGDRLKEAIEGYQRVLRLDDERFSWETLRRFSIRERKAIESKIERARSFLRHEQGP